MKRVKIFSTILGVIGILGCGFYAGTFADDIDDKIYETNGFIWSPMNSLTSYSSYSNDPNAKPSLDGVYYCKNSEVRQLYLKSFFDKQREIMLLAGLKNYEGPDAHLKKAYEAGQCKPVTALKILTKKSYTCEGAFSNGEFLDITYCKTTPETYKKARAAGKTNEQMEQVFERAEASIVKDFKAGKAK